MSVAVYLRVSTLDQENGIKSQEKAIADYLQGHGISDVVWYRDRLSGATIKRPEFAKLQRDIFNGRIKTVICWSLDRLSRNLRDGVNVLADWLAQKVRVVAISQQLDFTGPTGELIASVLFAVAAMQRECLREATKRGLVAARTRHGRLGPPTRIFARDIVALRETGLGMTAIAKQMGCTRQALYDCLAREKAQKVFA